MDVCTIKIEKKSELWKRSDQQLWGLKACIHSVNWTQALTVCPPSLPYSLPSSLSSIKMLQFFIREIPTG